MIRGKNERPQAVFNIWSAMQKKRPSSVDRDRKTIKNPLRENHARSLVLRLKSSLCFGGGRNWEGFFKKCKVDFFSSQNQTLLKMTFFQSQGLCLVKFEKRISMWIFSVKKNNGWMLLNTIIIFELVLHTTRLPPRFIIS